MATTLNAHAIIEPDFTQHSRHELSIQCLIAACVLQAEVTDTVTGVTYYFWCDQWMDSEQGDGKTERLLFASLSDPLSLKTIYQAGA